jgi:hypothetical protein
VTPFILTYIAGDVLFKAAADRAFVTDMATAAMAVASSGLFVGTHPELARQTLWIHRSAPRPLRKIL